jgi:hypothetical protein
MGTATACLLVHTCVSPYICMFVNIQNVKIKSRAYSYNLQTHTYMHGCLVTSSAAHSAVLSSVLKVNFYNRKMRLTEMQIFASK